MKRTLTQYELSMTAVMLFVDDENQADADTQFESSIKNTKTPAPDSIDFAAYGELTNREFRLYRKDAEVFIDDSYKIHDARKDYIEKSRTDKVAISPSGGTVKQVTLEEVQQHTPVPDMGDVVDALAGKTSLSNVLGTTGDMGGMSSGDLTKIKDYIKDITRGTAMLNMELAVGSQGSTSPMSGLQAKTLELAEHVNNLMVLLDPTKTEDILDGQVFKENHDA